MYDVLPFVVDTPVGPMVQAGIIPLVLAPIWVLYGYLQPLLDEVFANDVSLMHDCDCCCTVLSARVHCLACSVMLCYSLYASVLMGCGLPQPATERAIQRAESLPYNLLCWGSMAAMFLLSSYLYLADWPHWQISLALAPVALANWKAFDGTKQGALLAVLLAFGAPTAESFISNVFGWWHYERPQIGGKPGRLPGWWVSPFGMVLLYSGWCTLAGAGMAAFGLQHCNMRTTCNTANIDLAGVVAWAGWCYASYTHGVGNSARFFKNFYRK